MTSASGSPHIFDPLIQSADIAFDEADLLICVGCKRRNAPDRSACIYCGRSLENPNATKLNLRKLEEWEPGFSIIARDLNGSEVEKIASLTGIEHSRLPEILGSTVPLPLLRLDDPTQAKALAERIAEFGGICEVVADADLAIEKPPIRLRSVEFFGEVVELHDFNNDNVYKVPTQHIILLVTGRILVSKTDALEKRRRGGKRDAIHETSTASDEAVADYTVESAVGFRVRLSGFDFSCLGSERKLLAADNFRLLIERFRSMSAAISIVDHVAVRHFLDDVWQPETRNDAQGLRIARFGQKGFGRVTSTNNLVQFTRFSRMQRHLLNLR